MKMNMNSYASCHVSKNFISFYLLYLLKTAQKRANSTVFMSLSKYVIYYTTWHPIDRSPSFLWRHGKHAGILYQSVDWLVLVFFRTHFLLGQYIHYSRPIFDTVSLVVTPIIKSKKTTFKKLFEKINGGKVRGCLHDTGATFAPGRVHSGSLS